MNKLQRRFWTKVNKGGPIIRSELGRCWVWIAANSRGYGYFRLAGKNVLATHVAWFLKKGYLPSYLLHKCDNPACVRYSHLLEGTHTENMCDMKQKHRAVFPKGAKHPWAKLVEDDVKRIRILGATSLTLSSIGALFHITPQAVYAIRSHRAWRSL